MSEEPKTKGAKVKDQSHVGSGGYQDEYVNEEKSHQWQVQADNDPALKEAEAEGERQGEATQDKVEAEDPDYKPDE